MKIPGYQIKRVIGHGGMATVYKAVQTSLERPVALKVMAPALAADNKFGERFLKEAKTVARLTHPNILAIHDVGAVGPYNYIAMEYVSDGDLKHRIGQGPSPKQTFTIIKQVAGALDYAHKQGIVHRDIKPENILFRKNQAAVLTDFGIAKTVDSNTHMTVTGMSIGTPRYMSPEQAQGKSGIDGRSDLYSLGVVLYEALVGKAPFDAETPVGIALKHVQAEVPELPAEMLKYQPLIDKLMAKNPSDRYSTGSELIEDIDLILAGKKLQRPNLLNHHNAKSRPPGLKWFGAIMIAVALTGVGIFVALKTPSDSPLSTVPKAEMDRKQLSLAAPAPAPNLKKSPSTGTTGVRPENEKETSPLRHAVPADDATERSRKKIKHLLSSADQDLSAMRLTMPKQSNAADKYKNVLALDPNNAHARQGLTKIVTKYIVLSEEAISTLSFDQADIYLDTASKLNLKSEQIKTARKRIQSARAAHAQKKLLIDRPVKPLVHRQNLPKRPRQGDRYRNAFDMTFVYIEPGSFMMGSSSSETGRSDRELQHQVTLSKGYWIQTTEVTQAQWVRLMETNPSHFKGTDLPVESVSWHDAKKYISMLNQQDGKNITVRLPTEAEWEYAARAGTTTAFAFGDCLSIDQANFIGSSPLPGCKKSGYFKKTVTAGSLAQNQWGLFDMHGNVLEWCQDWLGAYPSEKVLDPTGPTRGKYKIIRGGSWRLGAASVRSAARHRYAPHRRSSSLGFRLAADPSAAPRSTKPISNR